MIILTPKQENALVRVIQLAVRHGGAHVAELDNGHEARAERIEGGAIAYRITTNVPGIHLIEGKIDELKDLRIT